MRCPACTTDNREGRRFCRECGQSLGAPCAACGFTNDPGDRFCGGCGAPVAVGSPAAVGTAPVKDGPPESHIPRHLAEKILSSKGALEGERKQVTVLFADLKGSMELLADRDPEEARAILDPVLERMMEAVHRYEGTVNQVMGDGIMALFGAPVAHEDHAVRACYAALRMQESVRRYAEEAQRRVGAVIQIRVGLNSGEVVVRSIGNDLKMDYSAIGQTTHLAARMEQTARPGSTLMTGDVFRLVEPYVQVKPLGPVNVKGLSAPVETYELMGAGQVRTRLATAAHGLTPFVGRERERAELEGALAEAAAGEGFGLALAGDPGVGKSRLVYELLNLPAAAGWLVLESAAVSYGRSTPYLPVIDLLRGYFQIDERDDAWKIREKVTTRLVGLHRPLERLLPAFLGLFDVPVQDTDWQSLDPPQRRWRTHDAVERLLLRESERQPIVLMLEDLHWADSETEAFVDHLVAALPSARILLLMSYRPDYADARLGRARYAQLAVEPLRPAAARALADALLGDDRGLEPLKERLIAQTQGNPLFLKEMVATLVETGAVVGERGAYRPARARQTVQVPSSVRAVLAARIDRLPPEEKRLLQTASVMGTRVPFSLLYELAELPEDTLRRHLLSLERAEFLYETEQFPNLAYGLKHVLTQEVAYASLLHDRRRGLHAKMVAVLEAQSPEGGADHVERLAFHALRGEVWDKAVGYYRQAAGKAATRSANLEAVECFEQALAALLHLPEGPEKIQQAIDLRVELRPTLLQLGRLDELLTVSQEAETLARDLGDEPRLARVYTYLINYHYLKGEPALAVDYGERCLDIARRLGDESLAALAERYLGLIYHVRGDYRPAAEIFKRSIGRLEARRDEDTNATVSYVAATGWRAFTLAELGEFDEAYALLDRAQHAAEASRHAYSQAIAYTLQGLVWLRQGQLERGVPPLERALQLCTEKSLAVWQPIPSSLLGSALVLLEKKDEGLRLLEDGVTLTEGLGVNAYLSLWTTHLAGGLLAAGQPERARALAAHALELARRHGERGHEAWALKLVGQISARGDQADREAAVDRYREALALASQLEMGPLIAQCHLGLGRLYRQAGDREKAEEHLTDATARFWETDMRRWLKQAELELADLGQLFIVGRHNPRLYDYLKQEFSGDEKVQVILDRRQGERQLRTSLGVAV